MISSLKNVIGENESVISEQMTRVAIGILMNSESDFGSFSSALERAERLSSDNVESYCDFFMTF